MKNDTINLHTEQSPHWSILVDWRPGRFDPISNAPSEGYPILEIRGRDADGNLLEPMHFAYGDGDGMMPPFVGWFVPYESKKGFYEVHPVEWQPLRACPTLDETVDA